MSLRFPYHPISIGHAVVPLGGRWVRPRPLVAITILGPNASRARDVILDIAADDTIFSDILAAQIGLDLTNAPSGIGQDGQITGPSHAFPIGENFSPTRRGGHVGRIRLPACGPERYQRVHPA